MVAGGSVEPDFELIIEPAVAGGAVGSMDDIDKAGDGSGSVDSSKLTNAWRAIGLVASPIAEN